MNKSIFDKFDSQEACLKWPELIQEKDKKKQ